MGGCLLKPQSRLLAQAKCSIVSSGRLLFVKAGIAVHKIKCVNKKIVSSSLILFFFISIIRVYTSLSHPLTARKTLIYLAVLNIYN